VNALPLVPPRPVPEEPANPWPQDRALAFQWHPTESPPAWLRQTLTESVASQASSRASRAPTFVYDAGASDSFRYTASFPSGGCATAIACASYVIPSSWTIRYRPQGTDFRWGTLRWCQADDRDGCFDAQRVALHEMGHIVGIDHPENGGFRLRVWDTVMQSITPAKAASGYAMHAYGPCDVATLQMRYGVPSAAQPISTCLDLDTRTTLAASTARVRRGNYVTFTATLAIRDRAGYRRLGGDPLSGRTVLLRRRAAGTGGAWTTFWMGVGPSAGSYSISIMPSADFDYQAVFEEPAGEGLNGSSSGIVTVRVTN
jgi:hypothetical protein